MNETKPLRPKPSIKPQSPPGETHGMPRTPRPVRPKK